MKLAAYCRVSTDDQENSLEMQIASIERYCEYHGYELAGVFVDEDVSAYIELSKRKAGSELLAFIESYKDDGDIGVVSIKVDRMFRNSIDALTTAKGWNDEGVSLYIVSMGGASFNTSTPIGWLFFQTLVMFAEFERNQISDRTKAVKKHLKDSGKKYGIDPYGWTHDEEGNMVVLDSQFCNIEHIFKMSNTGISLRDIAKTIESKDKSWSANQIKRILEYEPNIKEIKKRSQAKIRLR